MLGRGGWWDTAVADMQLPEEHGERNLVDAANGEWLLSKRLATECSLRPYWTGNGLQEKSSSGPYGKPTPT